MCAYTDLKIWIGATSSKEQEDVIAADPERHQINMLVCGKIGGSETQLRARVVGVQAYPGLEWRLSVRTRAVTTIVRSIAMNETPARFSGTGGVYFLLRRQQMLSARNDLRVTGEIRGSGQRARGI